MTAPGRNLVAIAAAATLFLIGAALAGSVPIVRLPLLVAAAATAVALPAILIVRFFSQPKRTFVRDEAILLAVTIICELIVFISVSSEKPLLFMIGVPGFAIASAAVVSLIPRLGNKGATREMPRASVAGHDHSRPAQRYVLYAIRVAAVVVLIPAWLGFVATAPLVDGGWDAFTRLLPYAAAPLIVSLAAIYFATKGRVPAAVPWQEPFFHICFFAAAVFGLLLLANEKADMSAATVHEVQLMRNYESFGPENQARYVLVFESWRQRPFEEIEVPRDFYTQAVTALRQRWELRIRDGWLRVSWVESMRPASSNSGVRKDP